MLFSGTDEPMALDTSPRGFGPTLLRTACDPITGRSCRSKSATVLREFVGKKAPRTPGVYGMIGPNGRLIYVGKAKNLRCRLLSYFRESSDPKAAKIIRHARALMWEDQSDEFAALLRELELIRQHRPRFNVLGQPGQRRQVYLCLGRGPAAQAYVTAEPTGIELAKFGPFVGRRRSATIVRRINLEFGLRDCPSTGGFHFADQATLFEIERSPRCLRYELGTCLAPCAAMCSRKQYAANVQKAKAFLEGRDGTKIDDLKSAMDRASEATRYELAASLRDRLQAMEWLQDRLTFLRTARSKQSFAYSCVGADGVARWYLIRSGVVRAVVREPVCSAGAMAALAAMDETFASSLAATPHAERSIDAVLLVTAWFRRNPSEKARLYSPAQAKNFCEAIRSNTAADRAALPESAAAR